MMTFFTYAMPIVGLLIGFRVGRVSRYRECADLRRRIDALDVEIAAWKRMLRENSPRSRRP